MLEKIANVPDGVDAFRAVGKLTRDDYEKTVEPLLDEPAMARHHRTHAVRAHLLEMAGDREGALAAYATAARLTASIPEQRYLNSRVRRLNQDGDDPAPPPPPTPQS